MKEKCLYIFKTASYLMSTSISCLNGTFRFSKTRHFGFELFINVFDDIDELDGLISETLEEF